MRAARVGAAEPCGCVLRLVARGALAGDQQVGDRKYLGVGGHVGEHELRLADHRWPQPGGFAPYLAAIDSAAEVPPTWGIPSRRSPSRALPLQPAGCRPAAGGCGRAGPAVAGARSPVQARARTTRFWLCRLQLLGRVGPAALTALLPVGITLRSDIGRVGQVRHASERCRPANSNTARMAGDWRGPSN